jgi:hypothetical protein
MEHQERVVVEREMAVVVPPHLRPPEQRTLEVGVAVKW